MPSTDVTGLHHVTAIAADARENFAFYTDVLGMRLVKRSVNQDDPGTYHLFYADAAGHPGTDLTFFPWQNMGPGRLGTGLTTEVSLAVPAGSLAFWEQRLAGHAATGKRTERFGEAVLPFTDPHGLRLTLIETDDDREFAPWEASPVPADRQVRRLHAVQLHARARGLTAEFLEHVFGWTRVGEEDGRQRFAAGAGGSGRVVDVTEAPTEGRGKWGHGTVHHVAYRVRDEAVQAAVRQRVLDAGLRPTETIDRFWFRSVYFLEPGGVLFELATDGPGFAVDEDPDHLGEQLVLPPWLEPHRSGIERALPALE